MPPKTSASPLVSPTNSKGGYHARALLSEGVFSQRLHQEPEATRPLLQHARRVSVRCYFRTLPGRNNRKSRLLAYARGQEQSRHDDRKTRLDGSGGEPDHCISQNTQ